ncbi:MAG: hypothetical protein QOH09_3826, partial [Pseudonocardiales bacterium]|nr:hypothetical protein [Pseudonocardiales bacterium]
RSDAGEGGSCATGSLTGGCSPDIINDEPAASPRRATCGGAHRPAVVLSGVAMPVIWRKAVSELR